MPKAPAHALIPAVFNTLPDCYLILANDMTVLDATDAYMRATMTTRETLVGHNLFEVFPQNPDDPHADSQASVKRNIETALSERKPHLIPEQQYDVRRPDVEGGGFEERFWSILTTPIFDKANNVDVLLHRIEDVTDRVQARSSLSRSEKRFRQLAETMPQIVWTSTVDGRIDYFNPRWYDYTGQSDKAAITFWFDLVHPDDVTDVRSAWANSLKSGIAFQTDFRLMRWDGQYQWFLGRALGVRDDAGQIINWFGTLTDIEEQKRNEADLERRVAERSEALRLKDEELLQARKMEAVGRLAGGVAHDFNNLLTGILGCSESLKEELPAESASRAEVEEIYKAATRASELTRQLLAFSRRQIMTPREIDLKVLIGDTTTLLKRLIGEDITLTTTVDPDVWKIYADSGQLEQVFMNIAINGRDAMPDGGTLSFRAQNFVVDSSLSQLDLLPGDYIMVSVTDTGTGMTPEVQAHIFEPFFTTKEPGKGTGLGLATAHGIIRQMEGGISVYSGKGVGTTFKVFLPRFKSGTSMEPETAPREVDGPGGEETILVVEDEELVAHHILRLLSRKGYRVLVARSPHEAKVLFADHPEIELLLTDVIMPGMNGRELSNDLRAARPELRILFMSGYPHEVISQRGLVHKDFAFIEKPFYSKQLCQRVREVLTAPNSSS